MKNFQFIVFIVLAALVGAFIAIFATGNMSASFVHTNKMSKSNIRVAVVSGHGSIYNGSYQTPGKQSPEWSDGMKLYEGYSCKMLAYDLTYKLIQRDIEAFIVNPDAFDMSLVERANRINQFFKLDSRLVVVSLHHNAQAVDRATADYVDKYNIAGYLNTRRGATGTEVYTSPGQTRSDVIASEIIKELKIAFPNVVFREDTKDGDPDKESSFYILTRTDCPAVLIEWMFMTTRNPDCLLIASDSARAAYTTAIATALFNYNKSL